MSSRVSKPCDVETDPGQTTTIRGPDRRHVTVRSIVYGMLNPRRRRVRRDEDHENAFLDWHPRHLLIAASGILVMSLADGMLTVRLVNAGVQEINPLLAVLVDESAVAFALVKWLLTACGVIALVVAAHARIFGRIRASAVLYAVLAGYSLLVLYALGLAVALPH